MEVFIVVGITLIVLQMVRVIHMVTGA